MINLMRIILIVATCW